MKTCAAVRRSRGQGWCAESAQTEPNGRPHLAPIALRPIQEDEPVNLFSRHGLAHEVVDFDVASESAPSTEQRLRRLDDLRRKGLLTDEEYSEQKSRILEEL